MFRKRSLCALVALTLLAGAFSVTAAEVDCDSTYCFSAGDFSEETLAGICITDLPDPATGTVMLGSRVLQPGDILTAEQLTQMTFQPLLTELDRDAIVTYLPIYENRVAPASTVVIAVRGKTDNAPVAEDSAMETYKNLPNEGALRVSDPEGKSLTYTVTRQPKRGTLEVRADGTFVYTPKKNKVGVDSFTYTATDPAGNVSREATVTVTILKPTDATQYTDTVGLPCRFAAEWMRNTGLFVGEKIGGESCFNADKSVSRGELVAMLIKTLGIPVEETATYTGYTDEIPTWLRPYLSAAMRAGLTAGIPVTDTGAFGCYETVTGAEMAVMLQNAMDLAVVSAETAEDVPAWAADALTTMNANGIDLRADGALTRGEVAELLYQISKMDAPGLRMYQ